MKAARCLLLAIGFAWLALSAQAYLLKSETAPHECVPDAEINAIVGLTSEETIRCKEFCKRYIRIYIQHTYMHAYMHACMHTYKRIYIHNTYRHTYIYIHSDGACMGICICRIGRIKADVDAMEMVDADNLKKNAADKAVALKQKGCKATAVALVKLAGAMQSGNLAAVVRPCAATPPSAPPTIPEPPSTSFFKRER